jgi:hypothetical protein
VQSFGLLLLAVAPALSQPADTNAFAARAAQAFMDAQKDFALRGGEASAAWHLGRASYDWAEFATNADQRATVARVGIAACQQLITRDPKSAPGHYYLGMDLGELAEAEAPSVAAYHLIREIEREFKAAVDLDDSFDYGGPLRCLGLLYRDAPGWPISIGSKRKARDYLERAAEVAPDFPENQMNLVESHVQWHEAAEAESAWKKLTALWPRASTKLVGVAWQPSWTDWTARRTAVRADFERTFKKNLVP